MLILTRRQGDAVQIDDDISIRVLRISNNQVRLGFEAPDTRRVWRKEIYDHRVAAGLEVMPESANDEE